MAATAPAPVVCVISAPTSLIMAGQQLTCIGAFEFCTVSVAGTGHHEVQHHNC
jgi:hypothetical protein